VLLLGRPDVNGLRTNKNVKGLVKALGWRKDQHVRGAAATALGQLGDPRAVNPLIRALNDSDGGVRGATATALGQIGDTHAVNPLITVIQNDEWSVREAAVAALGNIGAHAVGPLIAALHDQDEYVRRAAAEALGQIGDPRAVEALISALDESAAARQAAAEALGQIGDPDAVEPLIGALNDQNANVRKAAAAALDGLAWSPDRGATGAAYWVAKEQWKKCVKIAAIGPLIAVGCTGPTGQPLAPFEATKQPGGAAALHLIDGSVIFVLMMAVTDTGAVLFSTPGFQNNGLPTVSCDLIQPTTGAHLRVTGLITPVG